MDTSKTTDEQALIDKVIGSQINIPSQPTILLELDKLINIPNNQLSAISNLVNKDAGLSAAIFKLINSSFYKSSTPITNIKKAISVLGLTQVSSLIKGLSLRKAIGGQALSYEKFRERSGEIATLCALIAERQISACNISVDQACMAGLFHECGVPILMQRFPAYCGTFRLNEGSHWPDFREEDQRFNTDHTVVGFLVTKH
jgi:HD-like signal output (HDOD) protein